MTTPCLNLLTLLVTAGSLVAQDAAKPPDPPSPGGPAVDGPCPEFNPTLCVPLDPLFVVPVMNNGSGSGQASAGDPCQRNDDDSGSITLNGWSFDFYGTLWSSLWINNNGNVSFGSAFSTFTASGFPVTGFPMIAPFWGDVDTGNINTPATSGIVRYREWSVLNGDPVNRLVVTWAHVGYFNEQFDKLNTFQLILTDGNDPLLGAGNNVCFCYDDMQWTTGSASGGVGGFGGTPATVGANRGNGVDFFQIGRFDHAGTDYDGPGGSPDGVSFLDNVRFCFSTAAAATNTPPIFVNAPSQLSVALGDVLLFDVEAIGPELGQTVTMTVDAAEVQHFAATPTAGNPASASCSYAPVHLAELGTHRVRFSANDNGNPPLGAQHVVELRVRPAGVVSTPICDPAVPNSTGDPGRLWASGSSVASANDVQLVCADLPLNSNGFYIVSQSTHVVQNPGGAAGHICIASFTIGRYDGLIQNSGATGVVSLVLDLAQTPLQPGGPVAILAGETWNWQYWYRDVALGGTTSNFTNAVGVQFL